jgi:selenocysteine lyase/cysteine desulfurase
MVYLSTFHSAAYQHSRSVVTTRRDFLAAAGTTAFFAADPSFLSAITPSPNLASAEAANAYGFAPGLIYLNTGSAGPTSRLVLERTLEAWTELEKNPVLNEYSLDGVLGWVEKAREKASSFLGCVKDELLITRSTSEAMNTVAQSIRLKAGDRVITTDQEHAGGSDCWRYLAERQGIVVEKVAIPDGEHDPHAILQRFADAIKPDTRVMSFSHILYTTGLRMPVAELAALARSRKLLCVVDGAQAAGATPINVKALGCHAYATTGHKWLMGPKGVGMLYISSDAADDIKPVQWLGGKRYVDNSVGVGPLPLVVGLGAAIDLANERGVAKIEEHNVALRNRVYQELAQLDGLKMMSLPPGPHSTALVSFALPPELDSRAFQQKLREKYQLVTRYIPKEVFNGLRLSPHVFNTEHDVDAVLSALRTEIK